MCMANTPLLGQMTTANGNSKHKERGSSRVPQFTLLLFSHWGMLIALSSNLDTKLREVTLAHLLHRWLIIQKGWVCRLWNTGGEGTAGSSSGRTVTLKGDSLGVVKWGCRKYFSHSQCNTCSRQEQTGVTTQEQSNVLLWTGGSSKTYFSHLKERPS